MNENSPENNSHTPNHLPSDILPGHAQAKGRRAVVLSGSLLVFVILVAVVSIVAFNKPNNSTSSTSSVTTGKSSIPPAIVSITPDGYVPATIQIKVGQRVEWTNNDTADHTIVADGLNGPDTSLPTPDTHSPLATKATFSYLFNKTGSYGYHDANNPSFRGTVEVN